MVHEVTMLQNIDAYKDSVENPEIKGQFAHVSVTVRIILKWILNK
jgi:hypothetical protein